MAIELIDKIKQKNNGVFKLVDAIDVELSNGQSLQEFLDNLNQGGIEVDLRDYIKGVKYDGNFGSLGDVFNVDKLTKNGSNIYPLTLEQGVFDSSGKGLPTKLNDINALINDIKSENSLKFDNVMIGKEGEVLTLTFISNGVVLKTVSTTINAQVFQGETPPSQDESLIWIDTTVPDNFTGNIEDRVLDEFRQMIISLNKKIEELRIKNLELEARVSYLEENGVKPPEPPIPDPSNDTILLFEDGSILVDESGNIFIFEDDNGGSATNDSLLSLESSEVLIDENGNLLIFENHGAVTTFILMDKNGHILCDKNTNRLMVKQGGV